MFSLLLSLLLTNLLGLEFSKSNLNNHSNSHQHVVFVDVYLQKALSRQRKYPDM